jgi:hypothetical protein
MQDNNSRYSQKKGKNMGAPKKAETKQRVVRIQVDPIDNWLQARVMAARASDPQGRDGIATEINSILWAAYEQDTASKPKD